MIVYFPMKRCSCCENIKKGDHLAQSRRDLNDEYALIGKMVVGRTGVRAQWQERTWVV